MPNARQSNAGKVVLNRRGHRGQRQRGNNRGGADVGLKLFNPAPGIAGIDRMGVAQSARKPSAAKQTEQQRRCQTAFAQASQQPAPSDEAEARGPHISSPLKAF